MFIVPTKPKEPCNNGTVVKLEFDAFHPDNYVLLSNKEKKRIIWRIQVFSGGILLAMTTYVVLRFIICRRVISMGGPLGNPQRA